MMPITIQLFQQPKAFWVLACGELSSTFSYFGTQTILVLYFLNIFHLPRHDSYLLYGAYATFAYALPILGGIVADNYLGSKQASIIGSSLNILGNILLLLHHHYLFCLGLASSLVGAGLYKSNSTQLVGALYPDASIHKERGYTLLYLAVNVGGMLGPLIYGLLIYAIGWNYGFLCSTIAISTSLLLFIKYKNAWQQPNPLPQRSTSITLLVSIGILSACLLLSLLFYKPATINSVICLVFSGSISYLLSTIMKYHHQQRRRLFALLCICFFAMFYFSAGLQIGTTITLFIRYQIEQGLIKTALPASIFSTLYPLFVLVLAPPFSYLWNTLQKKRIAISTPSKLAFGIFLAALGISVFAIAAVSHFILTNILIGNMLLSAGELALTPAVYTVISDLSPAGMQSTMIGCWLLFIGLGGYLSSLLASASHLIIPAGTSTQTAYGQQFLFIAAFTLFIALVLTALIPRLKRMMH